MSETRVGLLGAGNMAEALLGGWLKTGLLKPEAIIASDVRAERLAELRERYGIRTEADNLELARNSDVLVIAVKPQVVGAILEPLASVLSHEHLLISIVAGVSIATFEAALPGDVRVIRTMPNTPALVGAGATALAAGRHATAADMALARRLFDAVGASTVVAEPLLDAVTGLSGSGPGFVMLFVEALSDGGVKAGLPRDTAQFLASQTVLGAAKLLLESGEHPAVLKDRVTSPGGTTIAGLATLERGAFRSAVLDAVAAAAARSAELGKR
jgi:pyrroline-5-carboxylate reductase